MAACQGGTPRLACLGAELYPCDDIDTRSVRHDRFETWKGLTRSSVYGIAFFLP